MTRYLTAQEIYEQLYKVLPGQQFELLSDALFNTPKYSKAATLIAQTAVECFVAKPSNQTIFESYTSLTPEVLVSNKKGIEAKDQEITRLKAELTLTKNKLTELEEQSASWLP